EAAVREAEESFSKINIPTYTGSGWYAYTYKTHLNGAQNYFENLSARKKLTFAGPAHLERPFHSMHGGVLRWYDHWLKISTPASWTSRRCIIGSWAPTNGARAPIGRCRKRNGPSSISTAGNDCRARHSRKRAPTMNCRPMRSCRCRRLRPTR